MKAAGIKEKISGFSEILRGLFNKIGGGFRAVFAMAASLFGGIKAKNQKSKNKPAGKSALKKVPAENPSVSGKLNGIVGAKIDYITGRFLGHFPEGKRRPILFAFGGFCVFLMILIISVFSLNSGKPGKAAAPDKMAGISQEELFFPAEPDFLPDFILEREPRRFWVVEDIVSFWKSPADTEFWRKEIKTTVDKLMEGVP